jgi:hypothetical protein
VLQGQLTSTRAPNVDDKRVSAARTKVAPQLVVTCIRDVTTSFGRGTWPPDTPATVLYLGRLLRAGSILVGLLLGLVRAAIASALWMASIVFIQVVRTPRLPFSYEHLTRSRARALHRILSGQGGAAADNAVPELVPTRTRAADVAPRPNHTVARNPLRLRRPPLRIREVGECRLRLHRSDEIIVRGLIWPLLLADGSPPSHNPRIRS